MLRMFCSWLFVMVRLSESLVWCFLVVDFWSGFSIIEGILILFWIFVLRFVVGLIGIMLIWVSFVWFYVGKIVFWLKFVVNVESFRLLLFILCFCWSMLVVELNLGSMLLFSMFEVILYLMRGGFMMLLRYLMMLFRLGVNGVSILFLNCWLVLFCWYGVIWYWMIWIMWRFVWMW